MNLHVRYYLYAIFLVFIQGIVAKNIHLGTLFDYPIEVIVYPLMIVMLPVRTPTYFSVLMGFIAGLGIDMFYHTPGVHTGALVLTGFLRRFVVYRFEPRTGFGTDVLPITLADSTSYFTYMAILLVIHIFWYQMLTLFSIHMLPDALICTVLSFSVSFCLLSIHGFIARALVR